MEDPYKAQVIIRAYELWEEAGKPEGRDEEFYLRAEQELRDKYKSNPSPPDERELSEKVQ